MDCSGDLAWVCTAFPTLLPLLVARFDAGIDDITVDHTRWQTNHGLYEMAILDDQVVGYYHQGTGEVIGRLEDGRVITGHWLSWGRGVACDDPYEGSNWWGEMELTFSDDGSRFKSAWSLCDAPMTAPPWVGVLVHRQERHFTAPPPAE